jgi:hypothetical protein
VLLWNLRLGKSLSKRRAEMSLCFDRKIVKYVLKNMDKLSRAPSSGKKRSSGNVSSKGSSKSKSFSE